STFTVSRLAPLVPDGVNTLECLDGLARAGLVRANHSAAEATWAFVHALSADTAYQGVLPSQRALLHESAARHLEADLHTPHDALVDEVAYHYERSNNDGKAVEFLHLAAARAAHAYSNAESLSHIEHALERALALPQDERARAEVRLLELHGDILVRVGDRLDAAAAYSDAINRVSKREPIEAGRLHGKIAYALLWSEPRDNAAVEEHLDRATILLEQAGEEARGSWIDLQITRGNFYYLQNRLDELLTLVDAVDPAVRAGASPLQRFDFLGVRHMADLRLYQFALPDASMEPLQERVDLARDLGDPGRLAAAHFSLAFSHLWRIELDEAIAQFDHALSGAERVGDDLLQTQCLVHLTTARRREGNRAAVRELGGAALERAQTMGSAGYTGMCLGNLAWAAWADGDRDAAALLAEEAMTIWGGDDYPVRGTALWPLIAVAVARGELGRARELLPHLRQPWELAMSPELEAACVAAEEAANADALLDEVLRLAIRDRWL
ncbi:MAG TPA: hypothetical protein VI916_01145, partial [Acidimicrobiia bacterium]|nr:hypothetical protein [Acidimicrobiia bacterium]